MNQPAQKAQSKNYASTRGLSFSPAELTFMALWFGTPPFPDGVKGLFKHFEPRMRLFMNANECYLFQHKIEAMLCHLYTNPVDVVMEAHDDAVFEAEFQENNQTDTTKKEELLINCGTTNG